ncbi:MAG: hypothetical protein ACI89Z_000540 [Porticoccus sp.]|jgi:hypothetical protein
MKKWKFIAQYAVPSIWKKITRLNVDLLDMNATTAIASIGTGFWRKKKATEEFSGACFKLGASDANCLGG